VDKSSFFDKKTEGTKYDNYLIFKQSFDHLLQDKNLYVKEPGDYKDFSNTVLPLHCCLHRLHSSPISRDFSCGIY